MARRTKHSKRFKRKALKFQIIKWRKWKYDIKVDWKIEIKKIPIPSCDFIVEITIKFSERKKCLIYAKNRWHISWVRRFVAIKWENESSQNFI